MIVDLFSPHGHSINDGISPELSLISYASVDDAVDIIGKGMQLVKLDLTESYRYTPSATTSICWQSLGMGGLTSTGHSLSV